MFGRQSGHFSVDDNSYLLSSQHQTIIHIYYTRKIFHNIIGIIHRQVAHQSRHVIHEFALFGFHDRALTYNHHFGQFLKQTIHITYILDTVDRFL